jgi:hypothetical protein
MTNAIVPSEQKAPPPLQDFKVEKIHPDNINREAAIMRAMGLDANERKQLQRQRNALAKKLERAGYDAAVSEYKELEGSVERYRVEYERLKADRPEGAIESARNLSTRALAAKDRMRQLLIHITQHDSQAKLRTKLDDTLAVYHEAVERRKLHQKKYKEMEDEVKIYTGLIYSVWRGLRQCHHARYREGKRIVDIPEIERVVITDNVLYFKILTAEKQLIGWKWMLPYNVFIQNLLSEETMGNIQAATGHEVKPIYPAPGKEDVHGYWYAINRTDTPNGILKLVHYAEVMRWYPDDYKQRVTLPIGIGAGNKIKWVNFNDYPHWLVGGSTGSGKSNLINTIFSTLISIYIPAEIRIAAIDLKGGLELGDYDGVPHLLGPIVEQVEEAADLLAQLEAEMARRFELLKHEHARDLYGYNLRARETLPRIIVIFDEFGAAEGFGDLTARIHASVTQLVSRGRAAGINLIICTTDPRVSTVPGRIKSGCVVRIAGRTASIDNSRIILDTGDAAKIADVKGRMLLKIGPLPIEVQTPLISEADIRAAIETAKAGGGAPPMALPAPSKAEDRWTPEKIVEIVILHLGGHLSSDKVYAQVKESGISQAQVRKILETIYEMEVISFREHNYQIKRIKNQRYIVKIKESESEAA